MTWLDLFVWFWLFIFYIPQQYFCWRLPSNTQQWKLFLSELECQVVNMTPQMCVCVCVCALVCGCWCCLCSSDRFHLSLLRFTAGSQWNRQAPVWIWSIHRVPDKGVLWFSCKWDWGMLWLWINGLVCDLQDGGTALSAASQYGHSRVVETLLKNGANVHDQLNVSQLYSSHEA